MKNNSLSPYWARIVHRLHTLGIVESRYTNSISQLTEIGNYPRHITSANEAQSQSVDGSILWNFLNWHSGWLKSHKIDSTQGAEFSFLSRNNTSFHRLRLLEAHHDECLNCILKIFANGSTNKEIIQPDRVLNHSSPVESLAYICEQSLSRANRNRGFRIDLLTEGGLVSKSLKARDLSINHESVRIHCEKEKTLELFPQSISHIQSQRIGREIHTALYNSNSTQQATLRLTA